MAIFFGGWPSWAGGLSDKELGRLFFPRWPKSGGVLPPCVGGGGDRGKGYRGKGEDAPMEELLRVWKRGLWEQELQTFLPPRRARAARIVSVRFSRPKDTQRGKITEHRFQI